MPVDFAKIKKENIRRYGEDIGRIGKLLLEQRYDTRSHFIFELLQNAEDALRRQRSDAEANAVRFTLDDQGLKFSHFGAPFNEQDVQFICGIGESSEVHSQRLTDIGRFGIGFKSVYALTDAPEIHSSAAHFAIDSYVWPREIEPIDTSPDETVFYFPFRTDIPTARDEILSGLSTLSLTTLLFLREIGEVAWSAGDADSGNYLRESRPLGEHLRKVTIVGQRKDSPTEQSEFLVMDRTVYYESTLAGRVEIAFFLQDDRIVPVDNATLSVFFPTIVPTHFGAVLQGPFRTTPSRDNIPRDDRWNQGLVHEMTILLRDALGALRDQGVLDAEALNALPIHKQRFPAQELFQPLYDACANALREENLIQSLEGSHHLAGKMRIGRTTEIRELFDPQQLGELLDQGEPVHWVSDSVSRDKAPDLRKYLIEELAVQEIDPDFVTRQIAPDFLSRQPLQWLVRFYEFLNRQESAWKTTNILEKPIIRLSDGNHVAPFRAQQPQAYLPSPIETNFPTVHPDLCRSKESLAFLQKIGLTEPDPVDDVIHNLLPKYRAAAFSPSESEYAADLSRIHAAFATDSSQKKTRLIDQLRDTPFIYAADQGTGVSSLSKPDGLYLPTERLKALFYGIAGIRLVDMARGGQKYDPQRDLCRGCGVSEYLAPTSIEATFSPEILREMRRKAGWENNTASENITDQTLRGLDEVMQILPRLPAGDAASRARLLWEALSDVVDQKGTSAFSGRHTWFYFTVRSCAFDAAFVRRLNEAAWVPKPDGSLGRPSEVIFEDIEPAWKDNTFLLAKIPFKPRAVVELAQTVDLEPAALDLMIEHDITAAKLRELLGLGTNDPASSTPSLTPAEAVHQMLGDVGGFAPPVVDDATGEFAPGAGGSGPPSRGSGGKESSLNSGHNRQGAVRDNHNHALAGAPRTDFHTYVKVHAEDKLPDPEGLDSDERLRIEDEAINFILKKEPLLRRTPTNNPGFDLYGGDDIETATCFVEVKSRKGSWSGPVTLSSPQFDKAQKEGDRFWLYVVEHVGHSTETALYCIQNPAGKTHHFAYDPGWKSLADPAITWKK